MVIEQRLYASKSRDVRFDGHFYAGVITTGCYCRPGCGGRPKPENVLLFACAAAAEAAGLRPCKRCRPERAAGTPAWLAADETVCRALRLIGEGALDGGDNVESISSRVGVSSRQLRRLFSEHLGASPIEIAVARRAHFARRLIDETSLTLTQIAFESGFQSVRQFNHAMRQTYQQAPSEFRRRNGHSLARANDDGIHLRISFRPPFDWDSFVAYASPRMIPGVEAIDLRRYFRCIEVDGQAGVVEVTPHLRDRYFLIRIVATTSHGLMRVVERVRRLFDLDADPETVDGFLLGCEPLSRLVSVRPGLRVPGAWDPFELGVRAILGQQVTVRGATTLAGRLVERLGRAVDTGFPELTHLFPTPEVLADGDLAGIGIPGARAGALRNFARAVTDGSLRLEVTANLDEALAELTAVRGIGRWTAHYIAMRGLGERDAFPASDLGLRRALARNGTLPSEDEVLTGAEAWRPWRSYAAMHLWASQIYRDGENAAA